MKRLLINLLTYLFMLFAITFFSCEDKEIKVSSSGSKLVVGGIFFADSVMQVTLTRNLPLDSNRVNVDIAVENAEVIVYAEDELVDRLEFVVPTPEELENVFWFSPGHSRYRSTTNFSAQEGIEYKIVINAEGYQETVASTLIPKSVPIHDVQYSWQTEVVDIDFDPWGGSHTFNGAPFSITFQDSPDTENYYKIQCLSKIDFDYTSYFYNGDSMRYVGSNLSTTGIRAKISRGENVTEENPYTFQDKIIFSDEFFNGELHTLDFYMQFHEESLRPGLTIFDEENRKGYHDYTLFVVLQHITRAQYLYEVTLDEQALIFGDTFSEPVFVHSNVENGLGIFAGYSISKVVITE